MPQTVLRQIVRFVNIPQGTTQLAHVINVDGTPQIPDRITATVYGGATDLVDVTATDALVSVTNASKDAISVDVYCYLDHSIDRAYPSSADGLVPRPFVEIVSGGSGGGGGTEATQAFTYVAQAGDGADFVIPLPVARANSDYIPQVTSSDVVAVVGIACPNGAGDRTTLQFRVKTSANVTAGDTYDVVVTQRTA